MNNNILGSTATLLTAFVLAGCGGAGGADSTATRSVGLAPAAQSQNYIIPDSSVARPEDAGKFMHTNHLISMNRPGPNATSVYYTPAQIRTAYSLPSTGGSGVIVIVDAFDDSYALNDFNTFSSTYGLPTEPSTNVTASTNQVFQIVYASGKKPRFNSGWSQEESLDIEWAHAMAPGAKIVLVEAATNSNSNLYAADDLAATIANAHQCSNSWSGGESSGEAGSDSHFNHASTTYFFSSGDTGGARGYPAASPNVVAVGGTSLLLNANNTRSSETAWSGSGCGPSAYEPQPSYQVGIAPAGQRDIADVSADSDPNTGVIVHWNTGWYVFGGTSVACPMVAGIVNNAGANRGGPSAQNTYMYGHRSSFFDVTTGTAGSFSAGVGYDYPTGIGAPNGLTGF